MCHLKSLWTGNARCTIYRGIRRWHDIKVKNVNRSAEERACRFTFFVYDLNFYAKTLTFHPVEGLYCYYKGSEMMKREGEGSENQ